MTETQVVQHDAKERVAYDLMKDISEAEVASVMPQQETREYWITLYSQCWSACHGVSPRNILEGK